MTGNPFTPENVPNWKSMIEYAFDRGGYTGVDYLKKEEHNDSGHAFEYVIRELIVPHKMKTAMITRSLWWSVMWQPSRARRGSQKSNGNLSEKWYIELMIIESIYL